jgi:cytidine deaminase
MPDLDEMLRLAREARDRAYAPYSNYQVGAVLRAQSGRLYAGCNVENSAYPEGWCAEASAIAAMVMAGERSICEVLLLGAGPAPCTPCGGCRQKLAEFAVPTVVVHVFDLQGLRLSVTLDELMPHAFGPDNLGC